jgi:hypothetical protein
MKKTRIYKSTNGKRKKIIIIRDKEIKEAEKETKYAHSSDIRKVL